LQWRDRGFKSQQVEIETRPMIGWNDRLEAAMFPYLELKTQNSKLKTVSLRHWDCYSNPIYTFVEAISI
jgi:hypothetical protein